MPSIHADPSIQDIYQEPQFAIDEMPIKTLVKQVKHFERVRAGEEFKKPVREVTILPGMPGSGPQMHKEITTDIMKSFMRKRPMKQSGATLINKKTFRLNQEPKKEKDEVLGEVETLLKSSLGMQI